MTEIRMMEEVERLEWGVRSLRSSLRDREKNARGGASWWGMVSKAWGGDVSQEEHYLWSHRARKKPADLRKAWLEGSGRVGLRLR